MAVIAVPPKTKAKLTQLIAQRDQLQAALNGVQTSIDGVVETMRELMDVPDTWTLTNLERGFVPPEGEVAETGDPNHE